MNLETANQQRCTISKLFDENENLLTTKDEILLRIKKFYVHLVEKKNAELAENVDSLLSSLNLPKITEAQKAEVEKEITMEDLYESLVSMEGGKSPGNDGFGKEFYMAYWETLKTPFFECLMHAKETGKLSNSQLQSLIKLLTKGDRDRRYIGNWRPISLLNVDTKILSKTIANKLKKSYQRLSNPNKRLMFMADSSVNPQDLFLTSLKSPRAWGSRVFGYNGYRKSF